MNLQCEYAPYFLYALYVPKHLACDNRHSQTSLLLSTGPDSLAEELCYTVYLPISTVTGPIDIITDSCPFSEPLPAPFVPVLGHTHSAWSGGVVQHW